MRHLAPDAIRHRLPSIMDTHIVSNNASHLVRGPFLRGSALRAWTWRAGSRDLPARGLRGLRGLRRAAWRGERHQDLPGSRVPGRDTTRCRRRGSSGPGTGLGEWSASSHCGSDFALTQAGGARQGPSAPGRPAHRQRNAAQLGPVQQSGSLIGLAQRRPGVDPSRRRSTRGGTHCSASVETNLAYS
jgi:hypothetical protein